MLHVIQRGPHLHQVVCLRLTHLAHRKRAESRHPFHQCSHRHTVGELQQTIVEVDGCRVPEVDRDSRTLRRRITAASPSTVHRGHDDADNRVERFAAPASGHTGEAPPIGTLTALDGQASRKFTHDVLKYVRRERWQHPLAGSDRIQVDLNVVARVLRGQLCIDQKARNPIRHWAVLVITVAVDAGVERRCPVEARSGICGDPVELLNLGTGRQQELHRVAVHAQCLGRIHVRGKVHPA